MNKPFERTWETLQLFHHPTQQCKSCMRQHRTSTTLSTDFRLALFKAGGHQKLCLDATVPQGRPGNCRGRSQPDNENLPSQTNSEDFHPPRPGVLDTLNFGKPGRRPWRNLGEPWTSFRQPAPFGNVGEAA